MRNAFAKELTLLATENDKIVLLSGDIGNRLFDDYKKKFPQRFMNCGVAEANMTGIASGMALSGLRPITYTITPFATTRCLEQIRNDLCYHNVPAIIVGVGAGLSYANLGATHHSCEDISFLRSIPNMSVVCPADPLEVRAALRAALSHNGPVYLRLGKKGEKEIHSSIPDFTIGKSITISEGTDVCLLSTGNIMPVVLAARSLLEQKGLSTRVESFHTVKPLDRDCLEEVFAQYRLLVTVEEHSLIGGLGSAVAEWFVDHMPHTGRLLRIGTEDSFLHCAGEQDFARKSFGLTAENIVQKVAKAIYETPKKKKVLC